MSRIMRIKATCALIVLSVVGVGGVFAVQSLQRSSVSIGPYALSEVSRIGTGYQRAERLAFADGGRLLAVTCPRYNRVVIYRVTAGDSLEVARDIELEGRPVALCAARDRFYVLQRPPGDSRHVVPGWWETFTFDGRRIGSRYVVGFYPDDLALSPDESTAFILTSGRSEGGSNRPAPALEIVALGSEADSPHVEGRLSFDDADDPARLALSYLGKSAVVTLLGSKQAAAVDCTDLKNPRLLDRRPLPERESPYPSSAIGDVIMMPVAEGNEAVPFRLPQSSGAIEDQYLACTLPHGSGVRVYHLGVGRAVAELTLRGPLNLGRIKPTGLAVAPERGLFAVANRSGGVHLLALRPDGKPPLSLTQSP